LLNWICCSRAQITLRGPPLRFRRRQNRRRSISGSALRWRCDAGVDPLWRAKPGPLGPGQARGST
jgi:hypothetical protein